MSSSIKVVEDHNLRVGDVTKDEVKQCVIDINAWFERNGLKMSNGQATKEDLQSLQKMLDCDIPEALRIYLLGSCGQWWFDDKQAIDAKDIGTVAEQTKLPVGSIPFAKDIDDVNMLVVEQETGHVFEICIDEGGSSVISKSFGGLIENYRDRLLSGRNEFIEDVGVVEKLRK